MLQAERDDWNVSYELGDTWKNARKIKLKNSSLFKIDILVYPEFSFKNVIITQIYQILFDLSPAIEISLWKGMKATAQVKIPVYNDGYGAREGKVDGEQTAGVVRAQWNFAAWIGGYGTVAQVCIAVGHGFL